MGPHEQSKRGNDRCRDEPGDSARSVRRDCQHMRRFICQIQDTLQIAGTGFINVNVVVIISFVLVALYTFFSGIKGPTYTAIIKDILVWVMMLFMVWQCM